MLEMDFTDQGRRPTPQQILKRWKDGGRPEQFEVTYGETYAAFSKVYGRWHDGGNGCRGVNRGAVLNLLTLEDRKKA